MTARKPDMGERRLRLVVPTDSPKVGHKARRQATKNVRPEKGVSHGADSLFFIYSALRVYTISGTTNATRTQDTTAVVASSLMNMASKDDLSSCDSNLDSLVLRPAL